MPAAAVAARNCTVPTVNPAPSMAFRAAPSSRPITPGITGASGSLASAMLSVTRCVRCSASTLSAERRCSRGPSTALRSRRLSIINCSESAAPGRPGSRRFTPTTPAAAPIANPAPSAARPRTSHVLPAVGWRDEVLDGVIARLVAAVLRMHRRCRGGEAARAVCLGRGRCRPLHRWRAARA